jgi:hypothetical protein
MAYAETIAHQASASELPVVEDRCRHDFFSKSIDQVA